MDQPNQPENTLQQTAPPQPMSPPIPQAPQQQYTQPMPVQQQAATSGQPRNILAALLMTLLFGFTGLNQVYLGRSTQGWIRFGLFATSVPLSIIFIGWLILPVLYIWAAVDFFLVYLKREDGEGQPLSGTPRDILATKIVFIVTLVLIGLYLLLIAIIIAFGFALGGLLDLNNSQPSTNYPSDSYL